MRKKNVISKDKKRRVLVLKSELNRLFLKSVSLHIGFKKYNLLAKYFLQIQVKNNSYVRIKNYCLLTGRNKGVYRKFRLSRIKIRELLSDGILFNYSKVT